MDSKRRNLIQIETAYICPEISLSCCNMGNGDRVTVEVMAYIYNFILVLRNQSSDDVKVFVIHQKLPLAYYRSSYLFGYKSTKVLHSF